MRRENFQIIYEAVRKRDWTEVIALAKEAQEEEKNGGAPYSTPDDRVRRFEQTAKEFG